MNATSNITCHQRAIRDIAAIPTEAITVPKRAEMAFATCGIVPLPENADNAAAASSGVRFDFPTGSLPSDPDILFRLAATA
ncbi:hypothetical protein GCM10020255_022140 [Rhodococcus baikonurensis]